MMSGGFVSSAHFLVRDRAPVFQTGEGGVFLRGDGDVGRGWVDGVVETTEVDVPFVSSAHFLVRDRAPVFQTGEGGVFLRGDGDVGRGWMGGVVETTAPFAKASEAKKVEVPLGWAPFEKRGHDRALESARYFGLVTRYGGIEF